MDPPHFAHPLICKCTPGLLPPLGCWDNAALTMGVQLSVQTSVLSYFGYICRGGIAELHASSMLNFLRNHYSQNLIKLNKI